jgi:hypothetical protein
MMRRCVGRVTLPCYAVSPNMTLPVSEKTTSRQAKPPGCCKEAVSSS